MLILFVVDVVNGVGEACRLASQLLRRTDVSIDPFSECESIVSLLRKSLGMLWPAFAPLREQIVRSQRLRRLGRRLLVHIIDLNVGLVLLLSRPILVRRLSENLLLAIFESNKLNVLVLLLLELDELLQSFLLQL